MKATVLLLILAVLLMLGWKVYQSHSGPKLQVEPHAAEEIEKAKKR